MSEPTTATIVEASLKETRTWTMPMDTYTLVAEALENCQLLHGRSFGKSWFTVDRILTIIQNHGGVPDIRKDVTCVKSAGLSERKGVQGLKPTLVIKDDILVTP